MIGIISNASEREIVEEFFQLFKTPWEFYQADHHYDVILCTENNNFINDISTKVLIIYSSAKTCLDDLNQITIKYEKQEVMLAYKDKEFPVYSKASIFGETNRPLITIKESKETVGIEIDREHKKIVRVGFDLFHEVSFLLSPGQPVDRAGIPTMEIHISMLREWILNSGVPLAEIPPAPPGYAFIVCLTHDVDFIGIRNHKFDHTMWGFIYRAFLGSSIHMLRDRSAWRKVLKNWKAVFLLPLVYLGMRKDFWDDFDRYLEIEKDFGSTFFVIPFKNRGGKDGSDREQKRRAVRYDITDIRPAIQRLIANGHEIGLHGINAWRDAKNGIEEGDRILKEVGKPDIGVRMHWLYYSDRSPQLLEDAGFFYDSTLGYNDAVGYRAGTTQVFRPLGAKRLLELPAHIQDTALFYSGRMALTEEKAFGLVSRLIKNAQEFGGVLTINWHTRSLSPERLWDDFYLNLLDAVKAQKVRFATAHQVVTWFRKRRSVSFEEAYTVDNRMYVKLSVTGDTSTPDLVLRVHHRRSQSSSSEGAEQIQIPFSNNMDIVIPLQSM